MTPAGGGAYTRSLPLFPEGTLLPPPVVGSEYWLQGFSSAPRRLSEDFVRLRILP